MAELGDDALWFMAGYLVVLLGLGVIGRLRRSGESIRDFYLAGPGFGFVVLFLTFFATQYSGNTLLGFSGRAYQRGASYVVSVTFMVAAVTVIVSYAPRLYRLSRRFGYITPADYVFHRFGSHRLRVASVLLLAWGLSNYVLEQLVAMGRGAEVLSRGRLTEWIVAACDGLGLRGLVASIGPGELDFMAGVVLLVLVMLLYESLGGMRAVAWTDVVQGLLLFGGCGGILYLLLSSDGGLERATAEIARRSPEKIALPDGDGLRGWVSNLVLLGFGVAVYPHAIQRIFAARDRSTLRRSLGMMALMPLVTTLLAFLLGYVGISRFPGLLPSESDKITLYVLSDLGDGVLVRWLVIVVLTAVLAAIMSTADSALLSLGSMFVKDIYQPYLRPDRTPRHYLRVGRIFSWGFLSLLLLSAYASLKTESSIWLLIKLKLEFMIQVAPLFVLGLFWRGLTARTAFLGLCAGTAITLALWIAALIAPELDRSPLGISAGVWGLCANLMICALDGLRGKPRVVVEKGLIAGLAVLAVVSAASPTARAQCQPDSECRFKKPNLLVVIDYSSSMVGFAGNPAWFPPGQTATTRWDAQLDALKWILRYDDGFFADNTRIALSRFAHDPDPETQGTVVPTDDSFPPIVDGFALDVPLEGSDGGFLECRNSAVEGETEVLRAAPPPFISATLDPQQMMLTWTRGALLSAHALIGETRERHAAEPREDERVYEVILMTDGAWTCRDRVGQDCPEHPAETAALLRDDGVRTHVVAFADATAEPSLDEVALQGGTSAAIDATSPQGIVDALTSVLDDVRAKVIVPECTRGLPRVLVIIDGSSSMIEGDAPGETKWDKARFALSGNPAAPAPGDDGYVEPILDRVLTIDGREVAIEDVIHLGLMTFSTADEQVLLADFGPCMRDNFAWAMDPATSCEAPGCDDPYGGFPLTWTSKDSATDRDPPFVRPTRSYMPACNETPGSNSCIGQIPNTFTGEGLRFARDHIADYRANPAPFHVADDTTFVNVLITDGQTSAGSSDVQGALSEMADDGVRTYVIGFGGAGDLDQEQLARYATWGGTESAILVDPAQDGGAAPLADALQGVVQELEIDACCLLNDCSLEPEPPDPQPLCGDGRVEGAEACDDGADNASYGHCSARCDGPHLFCGDGRVDAPEQCDDGALENGDGCDSDCRSEPEDDAGTDFRGSGGAPPIPPVRPPRETDSGSPLPIIDVEDDAGSGDAGTPAGTGGGCGCRIEDRTTRGGPMPAIGAALLLLCAVGRRYLHRARVSPSSLDKPSAARHSASVSQPTKRH